MKVMGSYTSTHRILDRHFSHLFFCKNGVCSKKNENKYEKEAGY